MSDGSNLSLATSSKQCGSNPTPIVCQVCNGSCAKDVFTISLDGEVLAQLCTRCYGRGILWSAKAAKRSEEDQFLNITGGLR